MNITIFAAILFVITYVLMFAFQKIRPYVAVLSAVILIFTSFLLFVRFLSKLFRFIVSQTVQSC